MTDVAALPNPTPPSPSPLTSPPPSPPSDPDEPLCRICHLPSAPLTPLSSPCRCSGSIEHVHEACLLQWLGQRSSTACELCGYQFQFQPVYAPGAPSSPSVLDAVWGGVRWVVRALPVCVRWVVVGSVWLCAVPLMVYYAFTLYCGLAFSPTLSSTLGLAFSLPLSSSLTSLTLFAPSPQPPLLSFPRLLSLWLESQYGLLLCLLIFLLTLAGFGIRSVVKTVRDGEELERQAAGGGAQGERRGQERDRGRRRAGPARPVVQEEAAAVQPRAAEEGRVEVAQEGQAEEANAAARPPPPAEVEAKAEVAEAPELSSTAVDPSSATLPTLHLPPGPSTLHPSHRSLSSPARLGDAPPPPPPPALPPLPDPVAPVAPAAVEPPPAPAADPAPPVEAEPLPPPPLLPAAAPAPLPAALAAVDDWAAGELDDVPLSHWLGFGGPLHYFLVHVLSILVYALVFLTLAFFVPLIVGRLTASCLHSAATSAPARGLLREVVLLLSPVLSPALDRLPSPAPALRYAWHLLASTSSSSSSSFIPSRVNIVALVSVGWLFGLASFLTIMAVPSSHMLSFFDYLLLIKLAVMICLRLVLFPILHGVLVDLSTVPLFSFSLASRYAFALRHPCSCLLLHWALGMLLVLSLSFTLSILKRMVRRSLLRSTLGIFLRSAADELQHQHDLQPFTDMVRMGWLEQGWRTMKNSVVMVTVLLLGLAVPIKLVERWGGGVWPLRMGWETGKRGDVGLEVPLDLLLFHFLLPVAMERMVRRSLLVAAAKWWLKWLCDRLGLTQYVLLPEVQAAQPGRPVPAPPLPVQLIPEPVEEPAQELAQQEQAAAEVDAGAVVAVDAPAAPPLAEGADAQGHPEPAEEEKVADLAGAALDAPLPAVQDVQEAPAAPAEEPPPPAAPPIVVAPAPAPAPALAPAVAAGLEGETLSSDRIRHLPLRLFVLLLFLWLTHLCLFFAAFVVPLVLGRSIVFHLYRSASLLDLYTWVVGFNVQLAFGFTLYYAHTYLSRHLSLTHLLHLAHSSLLTLVRVTLVAVPLLLVLPLLLGVWVELTIILPLRSWAILHPSLSYHLIPYPSLYAVHRTLTSLTLFNDWSMGMVMLKSTVNMVRAGDFGLGGEGWHGRVNRVLREWRVLDVRMVYTTIVTPILYQVLVFILTPLLLYLLLWPLHALLPHSVQPETLILPYSAHFRPTVAAAGNGTSLFNTTSALPAYLYRPGTSLHDWADGGAVKELTAEDMAPLLSLLVLRYSFLLYAVCRCLYALSVFAFSWLRQWQARSFEERWVVAKRLRNAERKPITDSRKAEEERGRPKEADATQRPPQELGQPQPPVAAAAVLDVGEKKDEEVEEEKKEAGEVEVKEVEEQMGEGRVGVAEVDEECDRSLHLQS